MDIIFSLFFPKRKGILNLPLVDEYVPLFVPTTLIVAPGIASPFALLLISP